MGLGFSFWYKKARMPKKKNKGFSFWYKKARMPKRRIYMHYTNQTPKHAC
jgi:hypothetical protein